MKQYNSNENVTNYNMFNTIKVDNRRINITSVGNQFVTNSYSTDEVFYHMKKDNCNKRYLYCLILIGLVTICLFLIIVFAIHR